MSVIRTQKNHLAVQVGYTQMRAIATDLSNPEKPKSNYYEQPWRINSESIYSDSGKAEFTSALKEILKNVNYRSERVSIALSGEYCVTRVLTGTNDNVAKELKYLEDRSALYHLLGTGPKALGGSVRQIDPRHQHAMLTVVNQKTVDTLLESTKKLGLNIDLVEPTMISICRLLGVLELDHDKPVLLVCLGTSSCELGVSFQGQLLLNYRPAGLKSPQELPETLSKHIARLHRYCQRYARVDCSEIGSVFLSGKDNLVAQLTPEFNKALKLPIHSIDETKQLIVDRKIDAEDIPTNYLPPLGTMLTVKYPELPKGPNLIERIHSQQTTPVLSRAAHALWPLAASILMILGFQAATYQEASKVSELEAHLQVLKRELLITQSSRTKLIENNNLREAHEEFAKQIVGLERKKLFNAITATMPQDIWISDLSIANREKMVLKGYGYSEDDIYRFQELLESLDQVAKAEVESTLPGSGKDGITTHFTLRCQLKPSHAEVNFTDDTI